ncbi:hypothetical protein LzC2_17950 [Planctomycetes bacterium LzC2]|uniref:Uncharacterized protein n=1 Tax=Alienimonas chondri TaxID=2681879 RepID=A0ABX1VC72_9PLAN|nr:hypothetical protein [Alienimonas chondri]
MDAAAAPEEPVERGDRTIEPPPLTRGIMELRAAVTLPGSASRSVMNCTPRSASFAAVSRSVTRDSTCWYKLSGAETIKRLVRVSTPMVS